MKPYGQYSMRVISTFYLLATPPDVETTRGSTNLFLLNNWLYEFAFDSCLGGPVLTKTGCFVTGVSIWSLSVVDIWSISIRSLNNHKAANVKNKFIYLNGRSSKSKRINVISSIWCYEINNVSACHYISFNCFASNLLCLYSNAD